MKITIMLLNTEHRSDTHGFYPHCFHSDISRAMLYTPLRGEPLVSAPQVWMENI